MASSSAISREELEKLTVTQLKEKLKGRKLPVSGTKAELVGRLYDDILSEETILGGTGGAMGQEGTAGSIDLANLDVDAVLGLPGDGGSDSQSEKISPSPTKTTSARIQVPAATAKPTQSASIAVNPVNPGTEAKSSTTVAPMTHTGGASDKKVRLTAVSRMGLPISEESESKAKRAARFGGATSPITETVSAPSAGGGIMEDDAKAKRIARFGPISTANGSSAGPENKPKKNALGVEDNSKVLERAKRFGLPLGDVGGESTPQQSRESRTIGGKMVGIMASDEILAKRAKRFAPSSGGSGGGDSEEARKKQARLDRFGSTA